MKYLNSVLCLLLITNFIGCSENKQTIENAQATSLEKQIEDIHNTFLLVKESNSNVVLSFSLINDELISKIEILSNDKLQIASRSSEEPVCEGDGLAFVKCVRDYLKEAGCVVVKTCHYCAYPCEGR